MNLSISKEESQIISVTRTVATISIVLCHLVSWFPKIKFLGQLLNVGVPVFFIISGYLYGHKEIKNVLPWYKKQIIKIVIPIYAYIIICSFLLILLGKFGSIQPIKCFLALFQLTGFCEAEIGNITTSHLWFITFILLCYLITPLLQTMSEKINFKRLIVIISFLSIIEVVGIIVLRPTGAISWLPGVFSYIIAYYLGAFWNKVISHKLYITLSIAMFVSITTRLVMKHLADSNLIDSIIYDKIIANYTHCLLAFWIFVSIFYFSSKSKYDLHALYHICKKCDEYSYEIYICHYMFIKGLLSFQFLTSVLFVNVIMFIIITMIFAMIVNKIAKKIVKRLL